MLLAALLSAAATAAPVPFMGCPSDGQQGPRRAPSTGRTPQVAAPAATRLAFYQTPEGTAVLAPRGWHCFGLEGSNGTGLIVAPRRLTWEMLEGVGGPRLHGPVVAIEQTSGGTSGRFEVAAVAARLFPAAHNYVARVEAENFPGKPLPRGPYPADRRTYRGPYQLLYTTPAGRNGLGTRAGLVPDALPVDGVEWLHPDGDMDLTSLAARLPPADRPLVAYIIRQAAPAPAVRWRHLHRHASEGWHPRR